MWPLFVVFNFPPVGGFPYLIQIAEQIQIEHFVTIGFVETFDISILIRLAGLNVLNLHPVFFSPSNEFTAEKFGAVIGSQCFRQPTLQAEPLKHSDQALTSNRGVDLNMQQFSVKIVDHIKGPEPATNIERITHKVGGPDLVRLQWHK